MLLQNNTFLEKKIAGTRLENLMIKHRRTGDSGGRSAHLSRQSLLHDSECLFPRGIIKFEWLMVMEVATQEGILIKERRT
jgi:hypothetical protein